ncbi:MAG: tetratricopeptide repeat protein [Candidatus Aminicenantes bacterium]|nr:tetratricopeptide repeat protein [Candidatus Aminicenantes bacterium]
MKKIYLLLLILVFTTGLALAQNPADEAYIKAMTTNDPCQRVQMLKEYIAKYAGKGTQYENYAYANLCLTPCQTKTLQDTITYGEKALSVGGLDDVTKCQVLLVLAGVYVHQGQNLDKARSYANQAIETAKANKNKEGANPEQWNKVMGAGYSILGSAAEKAKDTSSAVEAYLTAYSLLKDPKILGMVKKMGKEYYDAKNYAEAEKVFRAVYNLNKEPEVAVFLGQLLIRNNKNDEALALLKEAYSKKKSGEVAFSIAVILAKKAQTDPSAVNEAIRYSLEAAFLPNANSEQAMKMAEGLFFTMNKDLKYNETVLEIQNKVKELEELTQIFNERFGNKNEEELSERDKQKMKDMLAEIEAKKAEIEKLKKQQESAIAKFNQLVEETKRRLGK